jgi:plasmid replication initiation protein
MTEVSIYQAPNGQELELVRKGNKLIEAKYDLTVNQQRILLNMLELIQPYDEEFKTYTISIADLAKKHGLETNKKIYTQFQQALDGLVGYILKIPTEDKKNLTVAWLSSALYREGEGLAEVQFSPHLHPYLLQLKYHYTEYPAVAVSGFKSSYSFRFYEWLQSVRYRGGGGQFYRVFTVAELREKMDIGKTEYKLFADFKRRIIEPALKEIDTFSDLKVIRVDYIKIGRAVGEIRITAEPKTQKQLVIIEEPKEPIPKENKIESPIIDKFLTVGVSVTTAKKWLDKFGEDCIKQNLSYSLAKQKEGKVKTNFVGYLAKAIEGNWGEGFEDVTKKTLDPQRKAELEAYKKEQEAEAKREKDIEEKARIFALFEAQSESLQDVILDAVEDKVESAVNAPLFIKAIKDERKKGKIKSLLMKTSTQFMEAMRENGLID